MLDRDPSTALAGARSAQDDTSGSPADLVRLGRQPYQPVWALQQRLQDRIIAAKRSDPPEMVPHTVLVVEHDLVFTLGKSGDRANLLVTPDRLAEVGAEYVEVDRGGDITFHGPGQVVVYPILDLDRLTTPAGQPLRDLHRYLRQLEQAVIDTCADWAVEADRVAGRTGVWVGPDALGPERKVCAMGVRCSRWVTMHGLALNVTTDLDWFGRIVPCGIDDREVTSMERESDRPVTMDAVTERLLAHLGHHLGLVLTERPASSEILTAEAT